MSVMKTAENDGDVGAFLASVANKGRAEDTAVVAEVMQRITRCPPRMWGDSIIGFGAYRYANTNGKELGWFLTGVAPRKQALTIYIMPGFESFDAELTALGPHKLGRSCLYLRRLNKVDLAVLEDMIAHSVQIMRQRYPNPNPDPATG